MFKEKYFLHLIVIISLFSDPYIWLMAITKDDRMISGLLILIVLTYLIKKKLFISQRDVVWLVSWIMIVSYILLHGAILNDTTQVTQSFGYMIKIVFLFPVIYSIKSNYEKVLDLFFKYNIIIMYGSVLLFFFILVGIELPSIEFSQGTFGTGLDKNLLYPLGIIMDSSQIGGFVFARINGLTDEPGQLALLITWLLILNEFTLKSSQYRKHLLFCGVFTFSLGYVISISFYLIIYILDAEKISKRGSRNLLLSIAIGIVIILNLGQAPKLLIDSRIISRFGQTSSREAIMAGDNRTQPIQRNFNYLGHHNRLLFGFGVSESRNRGLTRDFSVYGIASIYFRYLPLYLLLMQIGFKPKALFILLIMINFVQRPGIHFLYQMMTLTFIFYSASLKQNFSQTGIRPSLDKV